MKTPQYFDALFNMTNEEYLAHAKDMANGTKTVVASALVAGEYVVLTYSSMRAALANMLPGDFILRNAPHGEYLIKQADLEKFL